MVSWLCSQKSFPLIDSNTGRTGSTASAVESVLVSATAGTAAAVTAVVAISFTGLETCTVNKLMSAPHTNNETTDEHLPERETQCVIAYQMSGMSRSVGGQATVGWNSG